MQMTNEEIQEELTQVKFVPMRLELKKGINECYILDDSYNNDFIGLKVALDYLDAHKENKSRTLILSDILHAGKSDKELYKEVAKLLKEKKITRFIGIGHHLYECQHVFEMKKCFFKSTNALIENFPNFNKEMIIVKGARNYELEKVIQRLQEKSHCTQLEVYFESLRHNLNQYQHLLKSHTQLMVMIKANAYGNGILEIANFLQYHRVYQLGVAYFDEAVMLRKNGITMPIMIMNPFIESFTHFEEYNLEVEIYSISHLQQFLKETNTRIGIHLKIDTGMNRLGFLTEEIPELLNILKKNTHLKIVGIFTHFMGSEISNQDDFTKGQARKFENVYAQITKVLGYFPLKHVCNSAAIIRHPEMHYDMVRLGIGFYGYDSTHSINLRPSSKLITYISQIKYVKKGNTVGYYHPRQKALKKDSKIAVLPIGYEDGYCRHFGNGSAYVNVNEILCPTVGNVCMDMVMVDITDTSANVGDKVILFGENPSIEDLAKWANTIPYEILTNVGNRVKRVFIS